MSPAGPTPLVIALPERALLLVAGQPGAGKTTLLQRLTVSHRSPGTGCGAGPVLVLDSDTIRAVLAQRWPRAPYRRYRFLVHLQHRVLIAGVALGAVPVLVVHLPATGAPTRAALAALARLTRRQPRLVWIDASAEEARAGQLARRRVIPTRSFARHARRAAAMTRRLCHHTPPRGWSHATLLDRAAVDHGIVLAIGEPT